MMKQKGFTLLELLIVIGIIGILAGVVLVGFPSATKKAKLANALTFSDNVRGSLQPDMVAWWKFDETSGTVASDSWWNQLDGTVSGATWDEGIKNNALSFDGVDYVDVGAMNAINGASQLTISGWVKRNSGYGALFYKQSGAVSQWIEIVWHNSIGLAFLLDGNSNAYMPIPADNDWKLITCVFDGTQTGNAKRAKIYINGVLQSVNFTGTIPAITSSPGGTAKIGRDVWNSATLNALIDDVQIYSSALPVAVIQQHYAEGLKTHQNLAIER